MKIATMGAIINDQRKLAMKETVNDSFKRMLFALRETVRENVPRGVDYVDPIVPRSFLDIYRPLSSQMGVLNHNINQLRKVSDLKASTQLFFST